MRSPSCLALALLCASSALAQTPPARDNGLYATLHININNAPAGAITFRLQESEVPKSARHFAGLALGTQEFTDPKTGARVKRPFYNGLTFHRAVPGFMIQGGDPLGNGHGTIDPIGEEFHPALKFDIPGRVAFANRGPGSTACQFFITDAPRPDLNGRYTIFGRVTAGQPLVKRIADLPKSSTSPELLAGPVVITKVTFERIGPTPAGGIPLAPAAKPAPAPAASKQSPAPAAAKPSPAPAVSKPVPAKPPVKK